MRRLTLLTMVGLALASSNACSDGSDDGNANAGGGAGMAGNEFWPWLANYESPGCSRPEITCTTFVDERDGKIYRAVTVGSQTWMGSALNYGEFTARSDEPAAGVVPKLCPLDEPAWCDRAGAQYRWSVAMDLPVRCETEDCIDLIQTRHRGICPSGWHIPTPAEVSTLLESVGTTFGANCDTGLALMSTQGWVNSFGDRSGTDSSGLTVLPQVMTPAAGTVWVTRTAIWTAASFTESFGSLELGYGSDCASVSRWNSVPQAAYSVRCVAN